jgi:molybdopterin synthase catalytic subunit
VTGIATGLWEDPLDIPEAVTMVSSPASGGIALFVGTVRATPAVEENEGRSVVSLEYEAHDALAREGLAAIAHRATERWNLHRVVAIHRVGSCEVGEPTVIVACGSAHRAEALEACRWLIDELKASVPIWKKEVYSDGSSWVGVEGAKSEAPG